MAHVSASISQIAGHAATLMTVMVTPYYSIANGANASSDNIQFIPFLSCTETVTPAYTMRSMTDSFSLLLNRSKRDEACA